MKRRILTLLSLFLIAGLLIQNDGFGLFAKKIVYAVGDLTVTWATDPLFSETNIAPGFTQSKNVNVANGAVSTRPVGVKGILTSDPGNMKSVMNIEVKEGAITLYSNTLAQFFTDSAGPDGIFLSNLNPGGSKNYDFIVTFNTSAGNEFQNQTIIFDLQIGISVPVPAACQSITFSGPTIFGTDGNDRIRGTSKNELIVGFEGNDNITGGSGNDCIVAGLGNDVIDGGSGNDSILAEEGSDKATGGSGNDSIFLGDGNDNAEGGGGNDLLMGDSGTDTVKGGSGNDTCDAESENSCEI